MNRKGLTLTELLVASALIGIVMIGVASFGASIERLQNSTSKSTILGIKVGNVMGRLSRDAFLTVGDETDRGMMTGGVGKKESVCFRHDGTPDPSSYTDDTWACYFIDNQKKLYLCDPDVIPPVDNWADCKSGTGDPVELILLDDAIFFTIVDEPADGPFQYVDINLSAIYERNKPFHPIKNPRSVLTSRVSPPGHSG